MTSDDFYIVISGKKKFASELAVLFQNFELLVEKETRKTFLLYLDSDYPVKDPLLHDLFLILYKRFQKGNRLIQGKRLIPSLLQHNDEEKGGRQLKRLIKKLTAEVLRFLAFQQLEQSPVERNRLIVAAVSPQVRPEVYRRALREFAAAVSVLPLGVEQSLYAWELAYRGHFSLSAPKESNDSTSFRNLGQVTDNLTGLLQLIYQCESVNRNGIWEEEQLAGDTPPLVELYRKLIELKETSSFQKDLYDEIRTQFLQLVPQLNDVQKFSIVTHLVNYLNLQHRQGLTIANLEIMKWTKWQLRPNMYPSFRVLSKTWFLNQISNAIAIGNFEVAQRVIEVHQHVLDEEERPLAIIHGNALIHLGKDDHRNAYLSITRAFHDHKLLPHSDGMRLKSFRLMSALCLFANAPDEWQDQYDLALRDYEVYLGRHQAGIENNRWQYYRNMLVIIRKCYNEIAKTGNLDAVHAEVSALIKESNPLHAREWLRDFVNHFPPGRAPSLPVKPFANGKRLRG